MARYSIYNVLSMVAEVAGEGHQRRSLRIYSASSTSWSFSLHGTAARRLMSEHVIFKVSTSNLSGLSIMTRNSRTRRQQTLAHALERVWSDPIAKSLNLQITPP
jgi:hypothetical protein